jgi:hypothetical protein
MVSELGAGGGFPLAAGLLELPDLASAALVGGVSGEGCHQQARDQRDSRRRSHGRDDN